MISEKIERNDNQLNWLALPDFVAETTLAEKVGRVTNDLVFGSSLYGLYALATGGTGLLAYASYIAMGVTARKIASTFLGYCVCPAALTGLPGRGGNLRAIGNLQIIELKQKEFYVKKISIYKSGTRYDAVAIMHQDTIKNGYWTIKALGNLMEMETSISYFGIKHFANKCNTLLINGPSVSDSGGWPTRYQMGAGFEAGIQFLERVVKATHIIMDGYSLGAGMMGEAILNHDFTLGMKSDIRYLAISDRSFGYVSSVAGAMVSRKVEPIFYAIGMELDGVAAARKLSQLGIEQIIIQHAGARETDGVIPDDVSLAFELHKDPTLQKKTFLESSDIWHGGELPQSITMELDRQIQEFLVT